MHELRTVPEGEVARQRSCANATSHRLHMLSRLFDTAEAAGNFTVSVFRISESSGIPVMTLLQEFQGQSQPELTLTLAYYLNNIRSNSTLLGLNAATQPNFYVARNVRQ